MSCTLYRQVSATAAIEGSSVDCAVLKVDEAPPLQMRAKTAAKYAELHFTRAKVAAIPTTGCADWCKPKAHYQKL